MKIDIKKNKIGGCRTNICYILFIITMLLVGLPTYSQNFYHSILDKKKYQSDTILINEKYKITYTKLSDQSSFIVFFSAKTQLPDGECIFKSNDGTVITGHYKKGVMYGVWEKRDRNDSIISSVIYKDSILMKKYISFNKERNDNSKSQNKKNEINEVTQCMPTFKGGDMALRKFVLEKLFTPPSYMFFSTQNETRIFMWFTISPDEKVTDIKNIVLNRSQNIDLFAEGNRVIKLTEGKWRWGLARGKPPDSGVIYTVPIVFNQKK